MTISAITPKGRVLAFEPILRPVVALKSGKTRGSALDRLMFEDGEEKPSGPGLARLTDYDTEQVDVALLSEGLGRSKALHGDGRAPLLFAPTTFRTIVAPRGRREVLKIIQEVQERLGARVVLEVTHLDHGLPPSRLVEVLTLLRPTCKVVFARVELERRALRAVADCMLAGASLEAARLADPEDEELLTRVRLVLAGVGPRMMLHNLRTTAAINAAHAAGISYASLDLTHMAVAATNKSGGQVSPATA
jgi:hypothetical protein